MCAVPGTYAPFQDEQVCIQRIIPEIQVIKSKQRPRKLTIEGSDGHDYVFLLKGHEDLRQDERVMQLFGLVNTLMASDYKVSLSVCYQAKTSLHISCWPDMQLPLFALCCFCSWRTNFFLMLLSVLIHHGC